MIFPTGAVKYIKLLYFIFTLKKIVDFKMVPNSSFKLEDMC